MKAASRAGSSGSSLAGSHALNRHRLHWAEPVWWLAAIAGFFVFPDFHSFGASVLIMSLFATSLSLLVGYAGIISLGHAAFFGIGAYGSGLLAVRGWQEPISNALAGGAIAAAAALVIGPLILRLRGLALLMVTLAIGMVFYELANKATAITGGDDGLSGIVMAPVLGRFEWSVDGSTAYLYVLAWLLVVFIPVRRLVNSPFGLSLVGLRDNPARMRLIGARVLRLRVMAYVCSALMAGIAGALSAQTTAFVGLQVLSVDTSVDALVMAVIGGIANLYGGMIGAPLYMVVKYFSQQWNPFYWMFFVGCLLIVVTRFGHGGALQLMARALRGMRRNSLKAPSERLTDVLQGAGK
jgi:branched-chain amino acid transport system permease protein